MKLIDGLTVLYSEYNSNMAIRVIFIGFAIIGLAALVIAVVGAIKDKDISWLLCLTVTAMCGGIVWGLWGTTKPYTNYYVLMDENASYVEMMGTYGIDKIHHEGGNVYKITVVEE